MKIDVSAEAAAVAAKFDTHWGAVVRYIIAHPRISVAIAAGVGAVVTLLGVGAVLG